MKKLALVALVLISFNACTTLVRGGYPSTDLRFESTVEQVRVDLLASGRIVKSCVAPCTITARVADGYVVRFQSAESAPIYFRLRSDFTGSPWLWANALNLFTAALLDFASGALDNLAPAHIEIVRDGRTITARAVTTEGDK